MVTYPNKIARKAIHLVWEELTKLMEMNKKAVPKAGEEDKKSLSTIAMEMDKEHSFKLMKRVMLSAQQADFITFKLLVAKESS